MKHDPRLPRMPERPTLFDFFKYRFGPALHMLQSARLAQKNGVSEKLVLACLIHDIGNIGFIRADHGYWAAQLIEPYVDEEVAFAVRYQPDVGKVLNASYRFTRNLLENVDFSTQWPIAAGWTGVGRKN